MPKSQQVSKSCWWRQSGGAAYYEKLIFFSSEILVVDIAKYSTITASSRHSTFTTDQLVDGVSLENDPNPEDFAKFGFATGVSQLHMFLKSI